MKKKRSGRGCAPKSVLPQAAMARYAKVAAKLRCQIPFDWIDLAENFLKPNAWAKFYRLMNKLVPHPPCHPDFHINLKALESATRSEQETFAELIDEAMCLLLEALPSKIVTSAEEGGAE